MARAQMPRRFAGTTPSRHPFSSQLNEKANLKWGHEQLAASASRCAQNTTKWKGALS